MPSTSSSPDKRGVDVVLTEEQVLEEGALFKTDLNAPFAHPYFWSPFILMGNWL